MAALAITAAVVLAGSVILTAGQPDTGAGLNIISWFEADMDGDRKDELLVITSPDPKLALDSGECYGDCVKLYSNYEIVNNKPVLKNQPDYEFDLSELKPLKVQAGDINGDGVMELAVCVYKTAEFHPVPAKRPFFYDIVKGRLEPVWLGSRLARPFADYIIADADEDDIDEIISIEFLENGSKMIAVYDWKGFGFEVKCLSDELEGAAVFLSNVNFRDEGIRIKLEGVTYKLNLDHEEIQLNKE